MELIKGIRFADVQTIGRANAGKDRSDSEEKCQTNNICELQIQKGRKG